MQFAGQVPAFFVLHLQETKREVSQVIVGGVEIRSAFLNAFLKIVTRMT